MLLLSLTAGTSLPNLFDGQWGVAYTNNVVGPIEHLTNNLTVNNILTLALWGVAGLCFYVLAEYSWHLLSDWRHAEHDIKMSSEGRVIAHPARRTFLATVLWRMGVLCVAAIGFLFIQPLIQRAFSAGPRIVLGQLRFADALGQVALAILIWMFLTHGFVILLRLFLMRTRIFGDTAIE